ncbi:15-hydroxyprostaglandin dehydrogenase [NAD(+)]-like [Hyposmocoma kahamanoa]|uniref:15-hydroxyprostaglandin dehydrogenase [NAD(+)]-like n=1 Tax=Hyposmocoma kahamanoa TaxID=1477025 RepID=UPI000E6DA336|nr:15-hydroxyprostaglandin dehydrogenase [NAD(+)]-like [Hyposmocoma kahamanoa]
MSRDIKNKTVAITGAAEGLGLEIAGNYLKHGAKVVIILDINEKLGFEAVKALNSKFGSGKAVFIKCDVTTDLERAYNEMVDKFKTIDVLFNNAGILNEGLLKKTIDINVTALIEWSMKFFEHMRTDKGGHGGTIINLASIYGFRIDQYMPIYNASKFAVMGFTKSLGHEYNFKKFGVRVVAICPGFTDTKLVADPKSIVPEQQEDFSSFVKNTVWQKPEAVARAAVEVFQKADSGTAWLIEGARPIQSV